LRRIYIRQIDELTATAPPFWLTAMPNKWLKSTRDAKNVSSAARLKMTFLCFFQLKWLTKTGRHVSFKAPGAYSLAPGASRK
jgi:hypothetical protein